MAIPLQAATLALAITSLCPSGYFKDGDLCTHCQPGTFNNATDASTKCTSCTPLCLNNYLIIKENCTAAHDIICGCPDGTFDENFYIKNSTSLYSKCKDHSKCNAGYEVLHNGTGNEDTKCQACQPGTYSLESSLAPCQVCPNNCPYGLQMLRPCGGAHGIVCVCPDGTHDTSEFRYNDNLTLDLLKRRVCKEHSNCSTDYFLVKKGSHQNDSTCKPCNFSEICFNTTHNNTGSDIIPKDENNDGNDELFGLFAFLLVVFVGLAVIIALKRRKIFKRNSKKECLRFTDVTEKKDRADEIEPETSVFLDNNNTDVTDENEIYESLDKDNKNTGKTVKKHAELNSSSDNQGIKGTAEGYSKSAASSSDSQGNEENLWLSVRSLGTLASELTMEEVKKICRYCLVSENIILDIEHSSKTIYDKKVDLLISLQTQHKVKRCSDNDILEAIKSIEKSQLLKRVSSAKEMNSHIN